MYCSVSQLLKEASSRKGWWIEPWLVALALDSWLPDWLFHEYFSFNIVVSTNILIWNVDKLIDEVQKVNSLNFYLLLDKKKLEDIFFKSIGFLVKQKENQLVFKFSTKYEKYDILNVKCQFSPTSILPNWFSRGGHFIREKKKRKMVQNYFV